MAKKSKIEKQAASDPEVKPTGGLAGHLRRSIQDCGLSPYEIAQRAGIAPHQIYRFMSENRTLTLETVDKLLPIVDENFSLRTMGVDAAKSDLSRIRSDTLAYVEQLENALLDLKALLVDGIKTEAE